VQTLKRQLLRDRFTEVTQNTYLSMRHCK